MARQKLQKGEKKSEVLHIKFSPLTIMRLRDLAQREHLTVSTLTRKYILERLNHLTP